MDDSYFNSTFTPNIEDIQSSVLLFGPQVTTWTQQSILALQHALSNSPGLRFLKLGLESLELLEPILSNADLEGTLYHNGFQRSINLIKDFALGKVNLEPHALSNTVRAVLTVAFHVHCLLELAQSRDTSVIASLKQTKSSQGFCLGFLTSAAFSLSKSRLEFERNISIALRLAALIGTTVDAEGATHSDLDAAAVIAVRCKVPSDQEHLDMILSLFPDVRFSLHNLNGSKLGHSTLANKGL